MTSRLQVKFTKAEHRLRGTMLWSSILATSAGLAALFMFLTHIVAVRVLSTADYGEFSSAIALIGIVGVAASSVQAVTVREVKLQPSSVVAYKVTRKESVYLIAIALTISSVSLIFFSVSASTSVLLALWVPVAVLLARANGELQGRELQMLLHGGTTIITLTSLVSSSVFALVAPEVNVFLLGRLCVTAAFAVLFLRLVRVPVASGLRFLSPGIFQSTAIVGSMWFAANLDVLMGRVVLDEDSVGQIAVAALLVNSVLLMPGLIASVVYPKAVESAGNLRRVIKLLMSSVGLASGLQLFVALALLVTSDALIDWLAGGGHEEAKRLVFPLALAYIPIGASIVMSQFVLALGRTIHGVLFVLLVAGVACFTILGQKTASGFVHVVNWASWTLAIGLIALVISCVRGKNV